jgi:hypothetical protein
MKIKPPWFLMPLIAGLSLDAAAQSASTIVASVIAGGGSESGTIGQWALAASDPGEISGLAGGFWHTEEIPWLRIERSGDSVVIAWPVSFPGFFLEQAAAGGLGVTWSPVPQLVHVADGENQVLIPIDSKSRFYRLRSP